MMDSPQPARRGRAAAATMDRPFHQRARQRVRVCSRPILRMSGLRVGSRPALLRPPLQSSCRQRAVRAELPRLRSARMAVKPTQPNAIAASLQIIAVHRELYRSAGGWIHRRRALECHIGAAAVRGAALLTATTSSSARFERGGARRPLMKPARGSRPLALAVPGITSFRFAA